MTLGAFTAAAAARLEAAGWQVRSPRAGLLHLEDADRQATLHLAALHLAACRSGDWAGALARVAAGLDAPPAPLVARLRPLLRDEDGLARLLALRPGAIVFPGPPPLWWTPALDAGDTLRPVTRYDLDRMGLTDEAAANHTRANLRALPLQLEDGPLRRLSAPGGVGAGLLLIADDWLPRLGPGPHFALAPAQDLLFVGALDDAAAQEAAVSLQAAWEGRLLAPLPWSRHILRSPR